MTTTTNENPNTNLWDAVKKTDIKHTKKVTIGAYQYTAIDATYQQQEATKQWGPYGASWGLRKSELNMDLLLQTRMCVHIAEFFYPHNGVEVSFPITNAIEVYKDMNGSNGPYIKTDQDFAKKIETNTISKALSRLGFSADVFLGMFEDLDYMNALRIEQDLENVDESDDVMAEKKAEFFDWCAKELKAYDMLTNQSSIKQVYNKHIKVVGQKCEILKVPFQDVGDKQGMGMKFQEAQRSAMNRINEKNKNSQGK